MTNRRFCAIAVINFDVPEGEEPVSLLESLLSQMDEVGKLNIMYVVRNSYQISEDRRWKPTKPGASPPAGGKR